MRKTNECQDKLDEKLLSLRQLKVMCAGKAVKGSIVLVAYLCIEELRNYLKRACCKLLQIPADTVFCSPPERKLAMKRAWEPLA